MTDPRIDDYAKLLVMSVGSTELAKERRHRLCRGREREQ
jgi:hypothetical protein